MPVRWTDPTPYGEVYAAALLEAIRWGVSQAKARIYATNMVEIAKRRAARLEEK